MAEQTVNVRIHPDGSVEMEVEGVEGLVCLSDTQALVDLLGGPVERQELSGDAYVEVEEHIDVHQRQGW
jgi:hypothetical protein